MNDQNKPRTLHDVLKDICRGATLGELERELDIQQSIQTTPKGTKYTTFKRGGYQGFHILN